MREATVETTGKRAVTPHLPASHIHQAIRPKTVASVAATARRPNTSTPPRKWMPKTNTAVEAPRTYAGGTSGGGRWGAPVSPPPVRKAPSQTRPAPRGKTVPAPRSTAKAAPRPMPKRPAASGSTTKGTKSTTPTGANSPYPGASAGGFDAASLLPILLIAAAVIAGVYLLSHRKGKRR